MVKNYAIVPFGKFPLGGCFEEAYIAAITALGVNAAFYVMNFAGVLGKNEKGYFFSITEKMPLNIFEDQNGLKSETCIRSEEIIDETVAWLNEKKLVIVRVKEAAAFNIETGRKTQRSFSEHWILVYGYDIYRNKFAVLEHSNNVSAKYSPCEMDFSEYVRAYNKGNENNRGNSIYIISREGPLKKNDERKHIKEYFRLNDDERDRRLLKDFLTDLAPKQINVTLLNEVIKKYQKEKWIEEVGGIEVSGIDLLLKELFLIRTYCVKAGYKQSSNDVQKMKDHIEKAKGVSDSYYQDKMKVLSCNL